MTGAYLPPLYKSYLPDQPGGVAVFLVDAQNDFYSIKIPHLKYQSAFFGSIKGANDHAKNLAEFIHIFSNTIQQIYTTYDTHKDFHIAHPSFWDVLIPNEEGSGGFRKVEPSVFSSITLSSDETKLICSSAELDGVVYENCECEPKRKEFYHSSLHYCKELTKPRLPGIAAFNLTVWPPHCVFGTIGHALHPEISESIKNWELFHLKEAQSFLKGHNSKTEHYSAFRAEVVIEEDPQTMFNKTLLLKLLNHDVIYVGGEAKSHCVNYTIRDFINEIDSNPRIYKKFFTKQKLVVLLDGSMGSVENCHEAGDQFIYDLCFEREVFRRQKVSALEGTDKKNASGVPKGLNEVSPYPLQEVELNLIVVRESISKIINHGKTKGTEILSAVPLPDKTALESIRKQFILKHKTKSLIEGHAVQVHSE